MSKKIHRVNCIYNNQDVLCTNKKVIAQKHFWGTGARYCIEAGLYGKKCKYKERYPKPPAPPAPPRKKVEFLNIDTGKIEISSIKISR